MPEYSVFLGFLLLWLVVYYVGFPLLIRFRQRMDAHPEFEALDMDELDRKIAKFLRSRTRDLRDIGFDEPTLVYLPGAVPNVRAYLVLLVNRPAGDKALVSALVADGVVRQQTCYVEFSTRLESGEVFNTLNASELQAFPPAPAQVRTQVPEVRDPQELYELHRFVMSKHAAGGKKELYEPGRALAYLARFAFTEPYERRVKHGWLYYDEDGDCYRPTLKGAFLMTWGLLQPFKALRQSALRRRARKILEEFDQAYAR